MSNGIRKRKGYQISFIIKRIFLLLMAIFAAVPLIQVFLNSFRTDRECKIMPLGLPQKWVFNNYKDTWLIGGYGQAYFNSFLTAFIVIIAVLVVVGLGAYAISKLNFRLKGFFTAYFFVAISLPGFLYIVPDYFVMNKMGLVDTRWSLIIVYTAMQIPFNMLLLRTFLAGIPRELEEAAKIDGCSELDSLLKITLPIARSMFLTIAILVFVSVWNEFLWSNTFITTESLKLVATRFVKFTGEYGSNMARIYTASVITIAPVIALYLFLSRKFIEGMTSGSVKG
ncbi:carbohydrate ABC transporter permease [Anaerocolumna xylanovorans]|uniref:Raffinose/stachyose/melibiose transport system permease protein n=1 Tax=Anaerocolumna xylanovorans DSM 12503 TaxID=1121345 RepID=A0A1M7Y2N8_9FIRM|nr:carbohydrate ABC transporter permease [Anaerocolumna xylanovorans]SHO46071.1 raffinose/stachyose/melibiose transport system permease protein [Anaerocolumna xylanovorans DSM 12503]